MSVVRQNPTTKEWIIIGTPAHEPIISQEEAMVTMRDPDRRRFKIAHSGYHLWLWKH